MILEQVSFFTLDLSSLSLAVSEMIDNAKRQKMLVEELSSLVNSSVAKAQISVDTKTYFQSFNVYLFICLVSWLVDWLVSQLVS